MSKAVKGNKLLIRLSDFELREITLNTAVLDQKKKLSGLTIDVNVGIEILTKKKQIRILVNVYLFKDKDKKYEFGHFLTSTDIEIKDFDSYLIKNEIGIKIPDSAMTDFIGLALSTTRGVIYSHTANKPLNKVVLPIMSAKSFADELAKITKTQIAKPIKTKK